MAHNRLRWTLLVAAATALLLMLLRGATPGRAALFSVCAAVWYGLSRRKTRSLDRDQLIGGKIGRRS
jgi:hypothetical protein